MNINNSYSELFFKAQAVKPVKLDMKKNDMK